MLHVSYEGFSTRTVSEFCCLGNIRTCFCGGKTGSCCECASFNLFQEFKKQKHEVGSL